MRKQNKTGRCSNRSRNAAKKNNSTQLEWCGITAKEACWVFRHLYWILLHWDDIKSLIEQFILTG